MVLENGSDRDCKITVKKMEVGAVLYQEAGNFSEKP
jgi:hypothetical protein